MKKIFLTMALLFTMVAGTFAVDEATASKAFENFFSAPNAKYMKLKLNASGEIGTFIFRASSVIAGGTDGSSLMVNVTGLADKELTSLLYGFLKLENVSSISYADGVLYLDAKIDN